MCIWRCRMYWKFVLVSLQFAQSRVSYSCSSTCLTKAGRVRQGCPCRTGGNLALLRNSNGTKDDERRPYPKNTHTYILFSSSFHGRLSPQISGLIPLIFLSFSFFQTGFEAKAAFDSSRFVNLPTNRPASTSNFTIT